jgi:hypothetical protein
MRSQNTIGTAGDCDVPDDYGEELRESLAYAA